VSCGTAGGVLNTPHSDRLHDGRASRRILLISMRIRVRVSSLREGGNRFVVIGTGLIGSKTIAILRPGRAHESRSIPAAAQEQIIAPWSGCPARSRSWVTMRLRAADWWPINRFARNFRKRAIAVNSKRRYDIVLAFLRRLRIPAPIAERDAEGIQHHVSDATLRALAALTKRLSPAKREPQLSLFDNRGSD